MKCEEATSNLYVLYECVYFREFLGVSMNLEIERK